MFVLNREIMGEFFKCFCMRARHNYSRQGQHDLPVALGSRCISKSFWNFYYFWESWKQPCGSVVTQTPELKRFWWSHDSFQNEAINILLLLFLFLSFWFFFFLSFVLFFPLRGKKTETKWTADVLKEGQNTQMVRNERVFCSFIFF